MLEEAGYSLPICVILEDALVILLHIIEEH